MAGYFFGFFFSYSVTLQLLLYQTNRTTKKNDMNVKAKLTIEKSIGEVWEIMGNKFGDVHKWSSNFKQSKPAGPQKFEDINYSSRETITDRGITIQVLETFDPKNFILKYYISEGLPEIAKSARSTWFLKQISIDKTLVVMEFKLEPKAPLNDVIASKIEMGLKGSTTVLAEELKYFIENGKPLLNNK
jgi:hypothetical protein